MSCSTLSSFCPLQTLTNFLHRYCKRVYDSDASMRPTIFHLLLRIYLRPRPNYPLLFSPALALISSHASSIDAVEVFDLLPPLVALEDIRVFLEKTLRRSGERGREGKVVKSVARAAVDEEEGQSVDLEERRVKITEGRVYVPEGLLVSLLKLTVGSTAALNAINGSATASLPFTRRGSPRSVARSYRISR